MFVSKNILIIIKKRFFFFVEIIEINIKTFFINNFNLNIFDFEKTFENLFTIAVVFVKKIFALKFLFISTTRKEFIRNKKKLYKAIKYTHILKIFI